MAKHRVYIFFQDRKNNIPTLEGLEDDFRFKNLIHNFLSKLHRHGHFGPT